MGASYATDRPYEDNSGNTWRNNSEYNAYQRYWNCQHMQPNNTYQHYGNSQQYEPRRCIVCLRGEHEYGVKLVTHPVWPQLYCDVHHNDWETTRCCGCRRFKSNDQAKYIELGDGRKLCPNCLTSSIKSERELKPLIDEIHEFFKNKNLKVKKSTLVLLVSKDEMLRILTEGVRVEGAHRVDSSNIPTIANGVTTMKKWKVNNIICCSQRGSSIEVTKGFKTTPRKESSILILYGFSRVYTGRILAHEMMHVWINSKGLQHSLSDEIQEGLCEVMSKLWLEERCHVTNDHSRNIKKFAFYLIENGLNSDAYRKAESAVRKYNLQNTLAFLSKYHKFPL